MNTLISNLMKTVTCAAAALVVTWVTSYGFHASNLTARADSPVFKSVAMLRN